ncbi:MAG: hypothetical protein A2W26_09480 [Acidobacteria bacterium RBG_16_64_8]|nr:MAG: hypothetical protein A2W26_09480 [Acidobacteria bacterium RBG_16_64_8]
MVDSALLLPAPPPRDHERNEMWVDEQIWGHRLWDSQSSWLLFLEFLNVAEASHREGRLLDERGCYYPLEFKPFQRMILRNILFNNEMLFRISQRFPDSNSAWAEWLTWMRDNARGVRSPDFSYLKTRFASFQQFASLVAMLRASAVENETNRRWTTRFVFPFGPNALYEDLDVRPDGSLERQYINFGRTGELLYMMLCRATGVVRLRANLAEVFSGQNPWNTVVGLFQPQASADELQTRDKSYLPYRAHPRFDGLAEDWQQILELCLPGFDALPHLVTLSAFHVILYQLHLAVEWCGETRPVHFICEVVAPKKTLVRELSALNYQENTRLPQRAVEAYIKRIEESEEWRQAAAQPGAFSTCQNVLRERVRWPNDHIDYDGPNDPSSLMGELRRKALARHRHHVANIHRNYGRDVGLVSKRGTNKLRYAPTDPLLKALILANVPQRMEYKEFLSRLYSRYGLVFGDLEAGHVLEGGEYDRKAFQANAERLEQRLGSLGMLRRLSDACAYVQNPFSRNTP